MGEIGLPTRLFLENSYYSNKFNVSTGQPYKDIQYLYGSLCSEIEIGRKHTMAVHGRMMVCWYGGVWPNMVATNISRGTRRVTQNWP